MRLKNPYMIILIDNVIAIFLRGSVPNSHVYLCLENLICIRI